MTVSDVKLDKLIEAMKLELKHIGQYSPPFLDGGGPQVSRGTLKAIIAALTRLAKIDAGTHVLVPVDPTEAMIEAGNAVQVHFAFISEECAGNVYRAMIKEQNK